VERSEDIPASGFAAPARLAELYERHVGRAIGLARLLSGDPSAAEDIAHEAFIRSAGRLRGLRDAAAFEAYLQRTVVNLCRARWRRMAVEQRYLRRAMEQPVDHGSSEIEDRDVLWTALQELPERQRAAVVLRYYEDLPEERVGDVLRCSPRAVNALVSRSMAALRARLGTDNEPNDQPKNEPKDGEDE
jgi:RNA polymerase sigma-70 factor (sigma-E family)